MCGLHWHDDGRKRALWCDFKELLTYCQGLKENMICEASQCVFFFPCSLTDGGPDTGGK